MSYIITIDNNHLISQANKLNKLYMPKYIIIGLGVIIGLFAIMTVWSKLNDKTKNRLIAAIFGIIMISFVILIALLIF